MSQRSGGGADEVLADRHGDGVLPFSMVNGTAAQSGSSVIIDQWQFLQTNVQTHDSFFGKKGEEVTEPAGGEYVQNIFESRRRPERVVKKHL